MQNFESSAEYPFIIIGLGDGGWAVFHALTGVTGPTRDSYAAAHEDLINQLAEVKA